MSLAWPIELLAPARDLECGLAAIDHGADAVYVGAPHFGARAAAGNSLEDIEQLVAYAHRYWARVYVTMNTLLTDAELGVATELARRLAALAVDGLIVQDVGLLECELPPELPLIASTQMDNRSPDRVRFWSAVGFSRAVLARELSLAQLREIRAAAPEIELECFVHGALCVSYSGQCYLSHALGGRSANRGRCAQPCRKPYTLVDGLGHELVREQHLLSLRDLDLSAHLGELLDAGVTSFKIEGRLKDRAYVATAAAHYRRLLDALMADRGLERASSGRAAIAFEPDPRRVFHRGQTSYFVAGRPAAMATLGSPKSLGRAVGRVTRMRGRSADVEQGGVPLELHAGDGIVFFDGSGRLQGSRVNVARGGRLELETPRGIEVGTELHRNHDCEYLAAVAASQPRRAIAVKFTVRQRGGALLFELEDEDGNLARVELSGTWERAREQERARQTVERQLAKLGGTEFVCEQVHIELDSLWHVPTSALNAARRRTVERLREVRAAARPRRRPPARRTCSVEFPQRTLDYRDNVLNDKAAEFYRRHGAQVSERAPEAGTPVAGLALMTTKYCLLHELGRCPREGGDRPAPPYSLVDSGGRRLHLQVDCDHCEMRVVLGRSS